MERGKAQEKITVELLATKKDFQKVKECGSDSVQN